LLEDILLNIKERCRAAGVDPDRAGGPPAAGTEGDVQDWSRTLEGYKDSLR
jgi:hypothetical protein